MVVQISRQPQPIRNQTLLIWRLCNPCLSVSSHCACMNVLLCQILQIEQNCVRWQSRVKLYLFSHNSNIFKNMKSFFRFLFHSIKTIAAIQMNKDLASGSSSLQGYVTPPPTSSIVHRFNTIQYTYTGSGKNHVLRANGCQTQSIH